jgi:hypothetical protein
MFQGPVTSSRNCCRRACNIFPMLSAGVVAKDPNVAVGVIVEGLATDPKVGGQ